METTRTNLKLGPIFAFIAAFAALVVLYYVGQDHKAIEQIKDLLKDKKPTDPDKGETLLGVFSMLFMSCKSLGLTVFTL